MPQLNWKDPSGAEKRRKKEERIKPTKNVKVSSTDLVLVSLQRRVQLQAPELLAVANSYNCLVHNQIHKNSSFAKMKLINACFSLEQGFSTFFCSWPFFANLVFYIFLVDVYGFVDSHKDMNINKFRIPTTKHFIKWVKCETFKVLNFVIYWWWMQRGRARK